MFFFNINTLDDKLSIEIIKGSRKDSKLVKTESRKIYKDDIKKKLPAFSSFIIENQIKALRSKGHSVSSDTVEMNNLAFDENILMKLVEKLQDVEIVFFNKSKINIERSSADLVFKCKKSNDTLKVSPFVKAKDALFKISECSFINESIVVVSKGLYVFGSKIEKRWLKILKQDHIVLEKRDAKYFLEDFELKIIFEEAIKKPPIPVLFLTDPGGISAKLKFKYDDLLVDAFSNEEAYVRCLKEEREFKNDLIESGYETKIGENAFYCPYPKVFEALKLLIEIGWQVVDHLKKTVVLEATSKIEIKRENNELKLNAQITFDEELVETEPIFQTCLKQRNFLELGEKTALIDWNKYQKKIKCFIEEKSTSLPIAKIALTAKNEDLEESLLELRKTLVENKAFPEVLPSEKFLGKLLDYQKKGLSWLNFLYENKFSALLADEMGLGKTVQILAFFSRLRNFCPVIIIAPKSLVNNWKSEFKRFFPSADVSTYYGPDRKCSFKLNSFTITTYGTLREDAEKLSHVKFECVVLDESTFIKNDKTKTNKSASMLNANFKICLNGTPIENSIDDLVSQFNFLIPNLINSKMDDKKIHSTIAPFLLKRTKSSVEVDLPEKIEQIVYVDMSEEQKSVYDEILNNAKASFNSKEAVKKNKMHVFEILLRLRQVCCDPFLIESNAPSSKLSQALSDIKSVALSHKILVFSQFTKMLRRIKDKLNGYKVLYLDGQTSINERMSMIEEFQNGDSPCVFLISLKAAGYGLNLQAADYVFIFDPWWNEAVEKQAIDRAHRLGRSRSLIAKKYLTIDSIEEKIYRLKLDKLKASDHFIPQSLDSDDLYHLLH